MPHTCSTCAHWGKVNTASLRSIAVAVGECHGGPPVTDFKWPRSRATDTCASHSDLQAVAFATLAPVPVPTPAVMSREEWESRGEVLARLGQTNIFDAGSRAAEPEGSTPSASPSTASPAVRPASTLSTKRKALAIDDRFPR